MSPITSEHICPKHGVRYYDVGAAADKPDIRCALCELERAQAEAASAPRVSADIEPLRKGAKSWGATAAAADAQNRAPNTAPFIAVWLETDKAGEQIVKWSKANITYRDYCFMAVALMEFAQSCVREAMERKP